MTFVIGEPCIGTKDNSCVAVCPVDCIHPTAEEVGFQESQQLFIDPEECIDCAACVSECPVEAVFRDVDLPEQWRHFEELNAAYYAPAA